MSYTSINSYIPVLSFSKTKIFIDYKQLEPSFYSLYDVSTLQSIYGANTTTNTQDNTYSLTYQDYRLITIWDAGGTDTLDLSTTTGSTTIDLHDNTLNSVDQHTLDEVIAIHQAIAEQNGKSQHNDWIAQNITDTYYSDNLYTGKDNLAIAQGVVIENIITGSGNDTIIDNEVNNTINTGAGDDNIYLGNGGYDIVNGASGIDTIYLDTTLTQLDVISQNDNYLLTLPNSQILLTGIEQVSIQDHIYQINTL